MIFALELALGITLANTVQQGVQFLMDHRVRLKVLRTTIQKQNEVLRELEGELQAARAGTKSRESGGQYV